VRRYHIWTIGCQMNAADSARLASSLEALGYQVTQRAEEADIIVLNTCVVRQSAESRARGRLSSLRPLKAKRPDVVLAVMGCLVGVQPNEDLSTQFPFVDLFLRPSEPEPLVALLQEREQEASCGARQNLADRSLGDSATPATACVPVIYGCSHACSYCIVPARRGPERSRPLTDIVVDVARLAAGGVREVTLLGQIVDRYGYDLAREGSCRAPDLSDLLRAVHEIDDIWRVRFLTSHPSYFSERILETVAALPKVCEHIEVPVQAGHDDVLRRMRRHYTADGYRGLVNTIREYLPGCSIASDVIVGFPGETSAQFAATLELLRELRLDKVHVAAYSPRPGTWAERRMVDDVTAEEKKRRLNAVETLQEEIVGSINSRLLGGTVEVLVEDKHKGKWRGRTRTDKLVFFQDSADWQGRLADVRITWTGPWSMQGAVVSDGPAQACHALPASSIDRSAISEG
jgi:tRNA-2-methylthio-N6-dimethylallyladenosine synthase